MVKLVFASMSMLDLLKIVVTKGNGMSTASAIYDVGFRKLGFHFPDHFILYDNALLFCLNCSSSSDHTTVFAYTPKNYAYPKFKCCHFAS